MDKSGQHIVGNTSVDQSSDLPKSYLPGELAAKAQESLALIDQGKYHEAEII